MLEDDLGGISLDLSLRIPNCFPNPTHMAVPAATGAPEIFAPLIEVQLFRSRVKVTEYLGGTRTK